MIHPQDKDSLIARAMRVHIADKTFVPPERWNRALRWAAWAGAFALLGACLRGWL